MTGGNKPARLAAAMDAPATLSVGIGILAAEQPCTMTSRKSDPTEPNSSLHLLDMQFTTCTIRFALAFTQRHLALLVPHPLRSMQSSTQSGNRNWVEWACPREETSTTIANSRSLMVADDYQADVRRYMADQLLDEVGAAILL